MYTCIYMYIYIPCTYAFSLSTAYSADLAKRQAAAEEEAKSKLDMRHKTRQQALKRASASS